MEDAGRELLNMCTGQEIDPDLAARLEETPFFDSPFEPQPWTRRVGDLPRLIAQIRRTTDDIAAFKKNWKVPDPAAPNTADVQQQRCEQPCVYLEEDEGFGAWARENRSICALRDRVTATCRLRGSRT